MRRATATIPVVICTAATVQVREIEGYLQAHGIALVPKPFDIDDLLDAVRRGLAAPHLAAGLLKARDEQEKAGDAVEAPPGRGVHVGEEPAPGDSQDGGAEV